MENLLRDTENSIKYFSNAHAVKENVLYLIEDAKHPCVYLNPEEGIVYVAGKSTPDDPGGFYSAVIEHLKNYFFNVSPVRIVIKLDYCSSSSGKKILDILKWLESLYLKGNKIEIYWYQDEDPAGYCDGEDYMYALKIPFQLIELNED